jgi:hypothetical protein
MVTIADLMKQRLTARKDADKTRYNILTLLAGEFDTKSKSANPATIEEIARKLIKSNKETLAVNGNNTVLEKEIAILEEFLPKQMSTNELRQVIVDSGETNIGAIMKLLNTQYSGQFDRAEAAKIAKELQ